MADPSVIDNILADVDFSAVDQTAIEAAAPESESLPSDAESAPATEDPAVESVTETTEAVVTEPASVTTPEPVATPTPPQWDSPENPYFAQLQQMQERARQLVEQKAAERAQELQNERIRALADEDPSRIAEINQFVQEVTTPIYQRMGQVESELDTAAKLAVVYDQAVEHFVPDEYKAHVRGEVERLMRIQAGPQAITQDIAARKADREQFAQQVAARDKEIATLKAQLAAKAEIAERAATGADVVDTSGGTTSGRDARFAAATNLDEFIGAIFT